MVRHPSGARPRRRRPVAAAPIPSTGRSCPPSPPERGERAKARDAPRLGRGRCSRAPRWAPCFFPRISRPTVRLCPADGDQSPAFWVGSCPARPVRENFDPSVNIPNLRGRPGHLVSHGTDADLDRKATLCCRITDARQLHESGQSFCAFRIPPQVPRGGAYSPAALYSWLGAASYDSPSVCRTQRSDLAAWGPSSLIGAAVKH